MVTIIWPHVLLQKHETVNHKTHILNVDTLFGRKNTIDGLENQSGNQNYKETSGNEGGEGK